MTFRNTPAQSCQLNGVNILRVSSQAVAALLPEALPIEAMDDIGEDLGKAKVGTTIKALLDEVMEPIIKAHSDLGAALETVRKILTTNGENRSVHLTEFDSNATKALENFFPDFLPLILIFRLLRQRGSLKPGTPISPKK